MKKIISIISIFFIITIFIILYFLFFYKKNDILLENVNQNISISTKKNQKKVDLIKPVNQVKEEIKVQAVDFSKLKVAKDCSIKYENEIYRLAKKTLNEDWCLESCNKKIMNSCLSNIAKLKIDNKICEKINDVNKQKKCNLYVNMNKARVENDLELCNSLEEDYYIYSCIKDIIDISNNTILSIEECSKIKDLETELINKKLIKECRDNFLFKKSIDENNEKECEKISDCRKLARCIAKVNNFDSQEDIDNDGLSYTEEYCLQTDINNPDTDGDGYSDSDEYKNGYNPNGEGKLFFITE